MAQRRPAYEVFADRFANELGLNRAQILEALKSLPAQDRMDGYTAYEAIKNTQAWQDRFGWVMGQREKKGLSNITEGEIIGLERQYRQMLSEADLPSKFWNEREDFHRWIANDVSPNEIQERVDLAEQWVNNRDKDYVKTMRDFYGIGKKDLVAYALDRKKGIEFLKQRAAAAEIGAVGRDTKLDSIGKNFSETLVDKGFSGDSVRGAFADAAVEEENLKDLASLSGTSLREKAIVKSKLGMAPGVTKKIERLKSQERARFGGSSGGTSALGGSSSGSY